MLQCRTAAQDSLNLGQTPPIEFVTIDVIVPLGLGLPAVMRDIPLVFTRPHFIIGVASILSQFAGSNIYLHQYPLGYPQIVPPGVGSITISPQGTEPWIPLSNAVDDGGGKPEGRFVIFKKQIQKLYFDMDHPNGAIAVIPVTFFGADCFEDVLAERV